jgi:hypothetical protein
MVDVAGGGIRFDIGLERVIVGGRRDEAARLPELAEILPSREQLKAELDQVLPASRLVALLDDFLAPQITSGELLLPGGFESAFDGLRATMAAAAADEAGDDVRRAARLLRDEQATRDLLQAYRTTLFGA